MGTKLEELRDGCFARAMDDEPMFVLLARDARAPVMVRAWATQRKADISMGRKPASDMAVVEEAFACAEKMEAWREANDGAWRNGLFGQDGDPIDCRAIGDADTPAEGIRRGMLGKNA